MVRLFIFFIVCFFCTSEIFSQELHYTFTNLNEKDGLRNNIIFSLLKDSRGILWVGTQNGLNRFDGSHFYTFKKKRDGNSIQNNTVNCLCEDKYGNIWGGTNNGIFCFSTFEHKFITYAAPKDAFDNIVSNIQCNKKGEIYAATTIDLIKFDTVKKAFQHLAKITHSKDSTEWFSLGKNKMLCDEINNGLWIATRNGIYYYDNRHHHLITTSNLSSNPLFSVRSTAALARSRHGNFWFFDNTNKSFILFNPSTKSIVQEINIKQAVPDARGATIIEDSQHRLWFSNWSHHLLVIDLNDSNKISYLISKEGNSNTVAANFYWAGLEDENGTIWLGTVNGLSMCNPEKYVYKACQLPDKIPALKSNPIYLVEEDPSDKTWWIYASDRSLIHYFPLSGKSEIYTVDHAIANQKGLLPQNVFHIRFFNHHVVLTTSSGAWQLNQSSKKLIPFELFPKEYNDITIVDMMKADSMVYINDGENIVSYNLQTKKVDRMNQADWHLNPAKSFQPRNLLWKPGQAFAWTMNLDYIAMANLAKPPKVIKILKNDTVEAGGYFHSADMDNDGNIWVSNKGVGLYRYNPRNQTIKYWTELDGLVDNHLHSIKADNNGSIWMQYFNRAGVFNPIQNKFTNFIIPYAENNLNYYNNLTKRSDGIIMGNVFDDLFEFYPNNLNIVPVQKAPQLSEIGVSGQDYFIDNEQTLLLEPNQNSLRFKFGMILNASIFPHEFTYTLEGSDKDWVASSVSNEANYNNLPSGEYIFRVKAIGQNNAWQSLEKKVHILIKTPFYKSKWFIGLILISIASAIFYLYRYRLLQKEAMFKLESKTQLLEKEKTMVMYESLKQQLNPHFLFNSLTSLSGLIETDQQLACEFLEQMSGIYRYILKNGQSETVLVKDEIEFAKLYIRLQQTRFQQGLQVNIDIPEENMHYKIAPVTIQNLLENAIKHNIIDKDSPLIIDIFSEQDYLVVRNNLQKKSLVESSNKKGLAQFISLYEYLSSKPVIIEETNTYFVIKIPFI